MFAILVFGIIFIVATVASLALGVAGHRSSKNSAKADDILTFTSIAAVISGVSTFVIWASSHADTLSSM